MCVCVCVVWCGVWCVWCVCVFPLWVFPDKRQDITSIFNNRAIFRHWLTWDTHYVITCTTLFISQIRNTAIFPPPPKKKIGGGGPSENCTHQECHMNQLPNWGPKNVRYRRPTFCRQEFVHLCTRSLLRFALRHTLVFERDLLHREHIGCVECKAIPVQAWTVPEVSRRFRFPDFKTIGTRRW